MSSARQSSPLRVSGLATVAVLWASDLCEATGQALANLGVTLARWDNWRAEEAEFAREAGVGIESICDRERH